MRSAEKRLFLQWALINVLFLISLIVAAISYSGNIPTPARLVIAAVLVVYIAASSYAGWLSWHNKKDTENHLSEAIALCPAVAMLGTVSGFLVALGGDNGDINDFQQKVLGASSGLLATFIGIACMVVLTLIRFPLRDASSRCR